MVASIRTRIDGMTSAIDLSQPHKLRLSRPPAPWNVTIQRSADLRLIFIWAAFIAALDGHTLFVRHRLARE